jgi:hypothetical protein
MELLSNVLETCKLNSPEANYKLSTSKYRKKKPQTKYKTKDIYIIIIIIFHSHTSDLSFRSEKRNYVYLQRIQLVF